MSNSIIKNIELKEKQVQKLKKLYEIDSKSWALKYAKNLSELAELYLKDTSPEIHFMTVILDTKATKRFQKVIKTYKISLCIYEKLYQENPSLGLENYLNIIDEMDKLYIENGYHSEGGALFLKKIINIKEEIYLENPERIIPKYIINLIHLAVICSDKNQIDKAEALCQKAESFVFDLFTEDKDKWFDLYTDTLCYVAPIYIFGKMTSYKKGIDLYNKTIDLWEAFFIKDPCKWYVKTKTSKYIDTLYELRSGYEYYLNINYFNKQKDKNFYDEIKIKKHNLTEEILKKYDKLFMNNPEDFGERYLDELSIIGITHLLDKKFQDALVMFNKEKQIIEILYNKNKEKWKVKTIEVYETLIYLHTMLRNSKKKKEIKLALVKIQE